MSERKDGGAAFPYSYSLSSHDGQVTVYHGNGMSLRDWFAGQTMMAIAGSRVDWTDISPQMAAKTAYEFADALIKERDK